VRPTPVGRSPGPSEPTHRPGSRCPAHDLRRMEWACVSGVDSEGVAGRREDPDGSLPDTGDPTGGASRPDPPACEYISQ
jgi:hypothetical protein